MPVVRKDEAVPYELHGSRFTSYAAPARGSEQLCCWRLDVAPGTAGVPHRVSREEVLVVTAGALAVHLDGVTADLCAGDAVIVPAGSEFAVSIGERAAAAWVSTTPGLTATMPDGTELAPPWTV